MTRAGPAPPQALRSRRGGAVGVQGRRCDCRRYPPNPGCWREFKLSHFFSFLGPYINGCVAATAAVSAEPGVLARVGRTGPGQDGPRGRARLPAVAARVAGLVDSDGAAGRRGRPSPRPWPAHGQGGWHTLNRASESARSVT